MLVVGTYTEKVSDLIDGKGKGAYILKWDAFKGMAHITTILQASNVSYSCYSSKHKCLFLIEELKVNRRPRLFVYRISDFGQFQINLVQQHLLHGGAPCHVAISPSHDQICIPCYLTGNSEVFDIHENGEVSHLESIIHKGNGPNLTRQESAHPHMAIYNGDELFIVDLGMDEVVGYLRNKDGFKRSDDLTLKVEPGSGPRHMVFSKDNTMILVLCELSGDIYVFKRDKEKFSFQAKIKILRATFRGVPSSAAIRITNSEDIIYVSERATSTITVLKLINQEWSVIQQVDSGGLTPRDINIDPSGNWLVAANQDSHIISCFRINPIDGKISLSHDINLPSPACLTWIE